MRALYIAAGQMPEIIDMHYAEQTLGDLVEVQQPFFDEEICVAALLDREGMPGKVEILDEDLYELEVLTGPIVIFRSDANDLTKEDLATVESHIRCYEDSQADEMNDWNSEETDDKPDDEEFSHIRIVDGYTFGEMLRNERTEEQKYF